MRQIQGVHTILVLSLISLLLLTLVTNSESGSFLQKGFAASDTHIVASGDWHCTPDAQKTVSLAKSMNPQLILGLGDYSSEKTEACWVNLTKPVDSITRIAIGNHDNDNDGLANSYLNHYGLSKQFYSFDIKNVHVLTMATEDEWAAGSEQYNFVVNDLRTAANNPDTKWIVVTMHHPIYSSPNECSLSDCQGDEELSELYHPLFDNYGVDIVLQAHVRNYQRSFPLEFNQESPSNPTVTSTSKGEYKNPGGAIFAIVGTGGGELKHDLDGLSTFMAYQQDSKFGLLDMHFSENNLDARFVANDESTMDQFSIEKTTKKKVIERISDDTFSDTNIRTVSDKETTNAMPLAEVEDHDGKPSITFKLDEDATADNTDAKPLAQDGKPSITFKLDEEAVSSSNSRVNPLAGQDAQEVKPAMTTKVDDSTPADADDKPMLLSEEQVKQEQVKPTDDKPKPISLSEETSDEDKSATLSDNSDKSNVKEVGTTDSSSNVMSDEDSEGKTVSTNLSDPFASLN